MANLRIDSIVKGNTVMHQHEVEDVTHAVDDRGDTMTGALEVDIATATDALKVADASGNKKWSIQHGTNTVKQDFYSPEPDNKIANSGFESDLSSWSEIPSYTLNDQFTTNRSAGAVNGTSAEPTGGIRTVVDTENKLSISSSQLSFAGGMTSPAYGKPGLWYSSISRLAGKTLLNNFTPTDNNTVRFGFGTTQSGAPEIGMGLANNFAGQFYLAQNGVNTGEGIRTNGTTYNTAIVLRNSGSYYFVKGGVYTNWTLLGINSVGNTATLYPGLMNYNAVFTADNVRIPSSTWLPTPIIFDTFTRADGAIGNSETTGPDGQTTPALSWTGGAISTNKNVITPSLGSELVTNGDMETADPPSSWLASSSTLSASADVHAGSQSLQVVANAGQNGLATQAKTVSNNTWYMASVWGKRTAGANNFGLSIPSDVVPAGKKESSNPTAWSQIYKSFRTTSTSIIFRNEAYYDNTVLFDDASLKPLTLSSLFSTVSTSDADVIADANVTLTAGTQAGLVLNLDSTSSPANFIIVYHDGTYVKVDEAVAGVYTNKQSTTVTYVAGATLRAIREGTKLRVYYNNALVGSELTMTANTNTKHGLFSTYSGNSFDNFTLWPRGSGTTKFTDAPFEELTATRDTGTKYAGTASAKLVAGGVDATFLQSVTLPDTSTYTLIAYAYTTGVEIDEDDIELYYDTAVLTTSYTDMTGGWYRLTGTLTGVASAKNYGVKVKAGKTVYIDTISLQAGVGATIEVTFENSGLGIANATFENDLTAGGNIIGTIDGNV